MVYVAEQFKNDNSLVSTIVKEVMHAMAGEYSRELSEEVFIGQYLLIELGFRQGGPAGYGLRRVLLDQSDAVEPSSPAVSKKHANRPRDSQARPG